jgi:hypothetical protein
MAKEDLKNGAAASALAPFASAPAAPLSLMEEKKFHTEVAQDAGGGVSFDRDDVAVPLVYLLQDKHPVCDRNSPDYVEGAHAGMWWLKGAPDPLRDKLRAIPCGMVHAVIERDANRTFVERHAKMPADAVAKKVEGVARPVFFRANGNKCVEVRETFWLIDGMPFLLSCASSFHQFARELNLHFHYLRHPETGAVLPAYAHLYRLEARGRRSTRGAWFIPRFFDEGSVFDGAVSLDQYRAARAFNQAIVSGRARGAADSGFEEGEAGGGWAPSPAA